MKRGWLVLGLLIAGCDGGGDGDGFDQAACTDAGECFDAEAPDVMRDSVDAAPDAASDVSPMADAAPVDAVPDAAPADAAPVDGAPDAAPPVDAAPQPDAAPDAGPAPVASCDEIGSTECFGHPDCPDEQRCENVGEPDLPVPCCVPGRRGEIEPGGSCAGVDGQIECQSGVCIEGAGGDDVCSGPCQSSDDCPPSLPRCVTFPFGGTDSDWCFPE